MTPSNPKPTTRLPAPGRARHRLAALTLMAVAWQPILGSLPAQAAFAPPLIQLYESPFIVGERVPPQVMLAITKDHQLFKKAYDDFSDIDGDGFIDSTYKHTIEYYGYFDPYKCYEYADGSKRFEPRSVNDNKYCNGQWSGNFLNWATMARMDALRKVLFGGLRSPVRTNGDGSGLNDGDTASTTVVERSFLPHDGHAFVKYYAGADTNRLTPFSANVTSFTALPLGTLVTTPANSSISTVNKELVLPAGASVVEGEWVQLTAPDGSYVRGTIATANNGSLGKKLVVSNIASINVYLAENSLLGGLGAALTGWTVTFLRTGGITICNTTTGESSGVQNASETNTNLPRMRVARGDYALWTSHEVYQCTWDWNKNNENKPQLSGIMSYPAAPARATTGLGTTSAGQGDYFVRVQVCKSDLIGTERCKQYPSGNYKPIGLLQTFGETDRIRFGLMTGSYKRNLSGGVLRKNISRISDEIAVTTDGTFIDLPAAGVPAGPSPGSSTTTIQGGSIIRTMSLLRIAGYQYNSDKGWYGGTDGCSYQRSLNENGKCKSWGNPMSEIYYESLRYFAGETTPTTAFTTDDSTVIKNLATAKWPTSRNAILSARNYCAPISVLVVNGAVSTNEDDDQIGSVTFMENASSKTARSMTNAIGAAFGLTGNYYFGHRAGAATGEADYNICSGKSLTGLGEAVGICPEGPTLNGSYLMAGLAHHAHTNKVRTDIALPSSAAKQKRPPLRVDTYGVSIAGGIPRVPVKFRGETQPRVVIQPAYRLIMSSGGGGGGALVDARIVRQVEEANRSYGTLMLSWEDSEAGGDYDMDVWGVLSYELDRATNRLSITTDVMHEATSEPQGFGYVVSGTDQDGLHFHSGIEGFNYTDPKRPSSFTTTTANKLNSSGGCQNCQTSDGPTTAVYTLSTTPPAKSLEDPLYYASLFGGFSDGNQDGLPTAASGTTTSSEWDRRNNATGIEIPDGIPDNYFRVDNPLGLEGGLERTFQLISEQSSLASLGASGARIVAGSAVYHAKFDSGDWSGTLEALPISNEGRIGTSTWNAATTSLSPISVRPNDRRILTTHGTTRAPIAFRFDSLSTDQKAALNKTPSAVAADNRGDERLAYLRGDHAREGSGTAQFRRRSYTVLGDIVGSSPLHVGKPAAGIADASYLAFIQANASRRAMVYVGANDGMLHGFSADTGAEQFAYVPSPVYPRLSALTMQDYQHSYFVDGQLVAQDAQVNGDWRTYLVGGLGGGGQGVFALDVTNPDAASEGAPGDVVKWEFTDRDDPHMGYLYSHPVIRKLENGQWVAIISSGFNAEFDDGRRPGTGRAALFILKLSGPTGTNRTWSLNTDYWRIVLPVGATTEPNGIGGISTFDVEGNGAADYIYAGDLTGRLWRASLPAATGTWTPTSTVVFRALDSENRPQPITAPPGVAVGPQYRGAFVTFGTGKLLEPLDSKPVGGVFGTNTMYGIWDATPDANLASPIARSALMGQRILVTEDNARYANGNADNGALDFSLVSSYVPNYTDTARTNVRYGSEDPLATGPTQSTAPNQRGWYFDMPFSQQTGERSIYRPEVIGSFVIFVNAMPSAEACEGGGAEAQYALEMLTGGRSAFGGFDRDANGKIQGNNGDLLGDQSRFGQSATADGPAQNFFASRRESTGGFGQMSVMKTAVTAGTSSIGSGCDGAGLAPIGAQSYSSGMIGTQRLPGGCIGRVQWRELVTH